ncbi:hypothetical protein CRG98_040251 [Punica granatum]|uniref:Uncharacterized protein n=2 Tax=Punica granatum TaxID=22663 RepID=A0A2I0I5W2_PUNGR|nr:hypothetical protein CRG98_040251 [Punica granatum]
MYVENATERLDFYLDAFSSGDSAAASDLIAKAKFSSRTGDRLLHSMKDNEEGMLWERPDIRFLRPNYMHLAERFQEMELPLRGMELALNSCSSFPIPAIDRELRSFLPHQKLVIGQKLEQAKSFAPCAAMTTPDTKDDSIKKSLRAIRTVPGSLEDLSALFFLFCMELLQCDLPMTLTRTLLPAMDEKQKFDIKHGIVKLKPSSKNLVFAFKCSISLGLAVLLGLMYSRENGYWSGLTIAISFVTERQPTFTVANARGQGTAMGSVYGILCFFIFERFMDLRLLPLLPWIVFASFLRHSRMYGQAGGISAVIGALLILGRKNYGAPPDFAITRITEATIGLICFILVEILFEPARAATLARIELSRSFGEARECIKCIVPCHKEKDLPGSAFQEFRERLIHLKARVSRYETYTREAEIEPNFWFCPFPASCYLTLLESFSRATDLLQFLAIQMDTLKHLCWSIGFPWKDIADLLKDGVEPFTERVGSTLECLEKVTSIKNLIEIDKELQKKTKTKLHDIEMGALSPPYCIAKEDVDKISNSFLRQLNGAIQCIYADEGEEEVKSQMALSLGGLGFCIDSLMKETIVMKDTVKELITRQNPSCHVNLCEISCKVDALRS